jgi:hypothetical protein
MSIIATIQPKPATLSASTKKAFNAVPINDILQGAIYREGVTNTTTIKPSDIRMNQAAAITALGGKMSPQSFVLGLVFAAVRYAHGQQIDGTSLPSGSLTAINASLSLIKKGAGISALSLETSVKAGIAALLALPAPETKKKATTLPSVTTTTTTETTPEKTEPHWSDLTGGVNRDADDALIEDSENRMLDLKLADQAKAVARAAAERSEGAAKFERDAETSAKAIIASVASRRDAEAIAREIAATLGFRLVKIATKKAA